MRFHTGTTIFRHLVTRMLIFESHKAFGGRLMRRIVVLFSVFVLVGISFRLAAQPGQTQVPPPAGANESGVSSGDFGAGGSYTVEWTPNTVNITGGLGDVPIGGLTVDPSDGEIEFVLR